jgi:Tfp pilus assembly protein PilO
MRPWPQAHKNLAAILLLVLVAVVMFYFFALRPKVQDVQDLAGQLDELKDKLKTATWPLNGETLKTLLEENTKKLKGTKTERGDKGYAGIEEKSRQILTQATSTFKKRIEENYGNTSTFMDQSGWLDYQSDFSDLDAWLRGNGVLISEKTFGISQDTANAETYQLLLHIWTVRELVQLVVTHNLVLAKDPSNAVPTPEGGTALPSKLRVLPAVAYAVNPEDKTPYLLEFPVRLTLRGALPDLVAFIAELQTGERFLPISRIEIATEHPRIRGEKPNNDGVVQVQNIEATVVCSSFFRPGERAPEVRIRQKTQIPPGA